MKKFLIIAFFILTVSYGAFCKLTVLSGRNNLLMLKGAKPVYLFLTFNNLLIYNTPIDQFIAKINKDKVNVWKVTKSSLIEDYKDNVYDTLKLHKGWDIKYVERLSDAKKGFVIILNYDYDNPVPPVGANGQATGTIYRIGQKNPIAQFRINSYFFQYWDIKVNFHGFGAYFMEEIHFNFLNHINKNRVKSIK